MTLNFRSIAYGLLFALTAGFSGTATNASAQQICDPQWKTLQLNNASSVGGPRTYRVYVPQNGPRTMPVVYAFHGRTSNPLNFLQASNLEGFANTAKVVIVAPEAQLTPISGNKIAWYAGDKIVTQPGDPLHHDDQDFVEKLLPVIDNAACTNPRERYLMGNSSGGGMATTIACSMSEKFKAVGTVSGVAFDSSCYDSPAQLPFLHIHNVHDLIIPIGESDPKVWKWIARNGCDQDKKPLQKRTPWPNQELYAPDCPRGQNVVYHRLDIPNPGLGSMGHSWPTGANSQRHATRVIFKFFGLL